MSWSTPLPQVVAVFEQAVAADPRVERRSLFGGPAAFVGGHLVSTVFRDQLVLKLGASDAARLHAGRTPVAFEPLEGRKMRELYVVPRGVMADEECLAEWVSAALSRVASWPAKPSAKAHPAGRIAQPARRPDPDALPNIGPRSREWLQRAGIDSMSRLRATGSIHAYLAVKRAGGRPSLNLLWALEGALSGRRWQEVARVDRTSLLLALEDAIARPPEARR